MNRVYGAIVALVMSVGLFVSGTAPASATTCFLGVCIGGDVEHYTPDSGYDKSIIVFCNYGAPWENRKYVEEGTSSKADCGLDTDQIYIRAGEEMWCLTGSQFEKVFDAEGRHKITDDWSRSCTLRAD